jgi:PilZ domain-containing protein
MLSPENTRRWPRHTVDLPVSVEFQTGPTKTVAPGRGIEISEGGMALYAGIQLKAHDLVEVEFQKPWQARISGVVRNRTGCCFGVEFLSPLTFESENSTNPSSAKNQKAQPDKAAEDAIAVSLRMRDLYLHQRQVEIKRMQKDLAALQQVSDFLASLEESYGPANAVRSSRRPRTAMLDNPINLLTKLLKSRIPANFDIKRPNRVRKER